LLQGQIERRSGCFPDQFGEASTVKLDHPSLGIELTVQDVPSEPEKRLEGCEAKSVAFGACSDQE
jgi:hypothetical protein